MRIDITGKIHSICEYGITAICGCILFFLAAVNFVFSSYVDYGNEKVSVELNSPLILLSAFLCLGIFLLFSRIADRVNERLLFFTFTVLTLAAGIFLIANADATLRFDPLYVYESAVEISKGDYHSLAKDGYLNYCPYQLGLMTYERALLLLSADTRLIFLCNLLEIIGINFFLWRLTDLFSGHIHAVNVNVIFLSFMFFPQFFFILFAYGLIPGFFCLMAAFFTGARFVFHGRKSDLCTAVLFSCLAVFLKKNYLIGVIALTIWLLLECIKAKKIRLLLAALLLIPCCMLFGKTAEKIYESKSGMAMGDGVPSLLFICMGINPHNGNMGPGWYDGSNWYYFTECDQDSDAAAALAKDMIKTYLGEFRENPLLAVKFFGKKNISMWCDPLFQSVQSGPLESCGQAMETRLLKSLYRGELPEQVIRYYMKGYMLVLLVMCFLFLLKEWKQNRAVKLLLLYFIGGFLFHVMWEAKSQYVYTYIFVLIPLCAFMMTRLSARLPLSKKQRSYSTSIHKPSAPTPFAGGMSSPL